MSTDLLGHPVADPPPMNAPLPWRVWQVNNVVEWVMARTEREAIDCYVAWCRECGGDYQTEDALRAAGFLDVMRELTDEELRTTMYGGYDYGRVTFAQELARMSERATCAQYFATTEY